MPKVTGTRKQRAQKLLERIQNGPSFSDPASFGLEPLSVSEASRQYRAWAQMWTLEELKALVPELR